MHPKERNYCIRFLAFVQFLVYLVAFFSYSANMLANWPTRHTFLNGLDPLLTPDRARARGCF